MRAVQRSPQGDQGPGIALSSLRRSSSAPGVRIHAVHSGKHNRVPQRTAAHLEEWDAAWQSMLLTGYREMTRGVAGLDAVRFEYNRLRPPRCMQRSHTLILQAMDKSMDAVDAYRVGLSEEEIKAHLAEADELFIAAEAAMNEEILQFTQSAGD